MLEYLPSKNRGSSLGLLQIYWSIGAAFECFIAWLCIEIIGKQFENDNPLSEGWRWCMFCSSIIGFFVFFLRLLVPESPRYYLIKRDFNKVDQVIEKISKLNRKNLGNKKVRLVVSSKASGSMFRNVSRKEVQVESTYERLTLFRQFKMLFSK